MAKIFASKADQGVIDQVKRLLDQEFTRGSRIRVMPDAHVGKGSTIGTTMTVKDQIVPNLVGVDIGCGMETVLLEDGDIDLKELDDAVHRLIPAGFKIRSSVHEMAASLPLDSLRSKDFLDLQRAWHSVGTLGGGNHFIELAKDEKGSLYLILHSGSRHLGKQIHDHYQRLAIEQHRKRSKDRRAGDLAYLEGRELEDYLKDASIAQEFALINRKAMVYEIVKAMNLKVRDQFSTIHNYIDTEKMILRKGAISAAQGEKVLIPINMRDGSLIALGKGNPDWNYSAPHGAGRIMSRTEAKRMLSLDQYKNAMRGIYSSTIGRSTLDEAPQAYKALDEILRDTRDCLEVLHHIKPIYNFKGVD